MIAALRSRRKDDRQRWTDVEIRKILDLDKRTFDRAGQALYRSPWSWTRDELAEGVIGWALEEGRWPTSKDMDDKERKHGLPARSTLKSHWLSFSDPSPFEGCVRHIVQENRLFERLTPQLILGIKNVTVRRDAMRKYGVENLLRNGGGECVQEDDFGKLWRMPSDNRTDPHAQWVEVVNTTPEPDGTNAHYFLRIPPTISTAKQAVEWTFASDDLKIAVES